ncbi:hypothetical protein Q8A73_023764 [Channa argus]|nr:hypothetical protein Q8A73_023764 [Channa argus]
MAKSHSEYQGHGVQFAVPGARNSGGRGWRCVARAREGCLSVGTQVRMVGKVLEAWAGKGSVCNQASQGWGKRAWVGEGGPGLGDLGWAVEVLTQGREHEPGGGELTLTLPWTFYPGCLGRAVHPSPGAFTQAVEHEPGQGELTQALDVFTQAVEHEPGQGRVTQALDVFTQAVEHEPGQGRINPGPGCFYPGCGA